jgi:ribosomal-protein-alanine N-acetyltransferase
MKLRLGDATDAQAMAQVHARAFDTPWPPSEIAALGVGLGGFSLAAEADGGELLGFILGRAMAGEAEVLTLAVDPAARRQGLGRALVEAMAAQAQARGARTVFLEVAADNAAAIGLYEAAGFSQVGLRRGYYRRADAAPADALVMSRPLNT